MKKIIYFIIIFFIPIIVLADAAPPVLNIMGDVDGNGKVDAADYILVRKHILKNPELTGDALKRADVDGNSGVTAGDYITIRKIILGLINPTQVSLSEEEKICESVRNNGSIDYKSFASLKKDNDDFNVIKAAHDCANKYNKPVVVTKADYNIYNKSTKYITVKTNTNFNGSNIYIHDEDGVVPKYTGHVYRIVDNQTTLKKINLVNLKNGNVEYLKQFGYSYVRISENYSNKKVYIRYGGNANSGRNMIEAFRVNNGKIIDPITFASEYNDNTYFDVVIGVIKSNLEFKNGNFYTIVDTRTIKPEDMIDISGNKLNYMRRGILIQRNNVTIDSINHYYVNSNKKNIDSLSYGYYGFFAIQNCADIVMSNSKVSIFKNTVSDTASTYDITIDNVVNALFKNVRMYDYVNNSSYFNNPNQLSKELWGVIGSNHTKNITYDGCVLNRIDAHESVTNLTVKNSTIGKHGITVTGYGDLNIDNVTFRYNNTPITLRGDYGTTWDGTFNITNSVIVPLNRNKQVFLIYAGIPFEKNGKIHNFGYNLRLPTVKINGLTVYYMDNKTFYIYNQSQKYFNDARSKGIDNSNYTFDFPRQNYLNNIKNEANVSIKTLNYYG